MNSKFACICPNSVYIKWFRKHKLIRLQDSMLIHSNCLSPWRESLIVKWNKQTNNKISFSVLQRISPTHVTLTCVTRVTLTWRSWNLKQCQFSCSLPCTQTHITCHSLSHRSEYSHLLLDPHSFLWWSGYFHSKKDQGLRYILQWKQQYAYEQIPPFCGSICLNRPRLT